MLYLSNNQQLKLILCTLASKCEIKAETATEQRGTPASQSAQAL